MEEAEELRAAIDALSLRLHASESRIAQLLRAKQEPCASCAVLRDAVAALTAELEARRKESADAIRSAYDSSDVAAEMAKEIEALRKHNVRLKTELGRARRPRQPPVRESGVQTDKQPEHTLVFELGTGFADRRTPSEQPPNHHEDTAVGHTTNGHTAPIGSRPGRVDGIDQAPAASTSNDMSVSAVGQAFRPFTPEGELLDPKPDPVDDGVEIYGGYSASFNDFDTDDNASDRGSATSDSSAGTSSKLVLQHALALAASRPRVPLHELTSLLRSNGIHPNRPLWPLLLRRRAPGTLRMWSFHDGAPRRFFARAAGAGAEVGRDSDAPHFVDYGTQGRVPVGWDEDDSAGEEGGSGAGGATTPIARSPAPPGSPSAPPAVSDRQLCEAAARYVRGRRWPVSLPVLLEHLVNKGLFFGSPASLWSTLLNKRAPGELRMWGWVEGRTPRRFLGEPGGESEQAVEQARGKEKFEDHGTWM
ncbi:hypothetical protein DFJ74DRAFT_766457 [Hyaloraphidium curvatum]|nr:hypothetical protein DFJ74DRAFT_766457 [Hyaloraphidium curvatum]